MYDTACDYQTTALSVSSRMNIEYDNVIIIHRLMLFSVVFFLKFLAGIIHRSVISSSLLIQ